MKTIKDLSVIVVSIVVSLLLIEISARFYFLITNINTNTESRPFEPYFESGDFFGNVNNTALVEGKEGPDKYGYTERYGVYFNTSKDISWNASSRSDFLFNHYLSRYSTKDVDRISAEHPNAIRIMVIGGSAAQGSSASSKDKVWHALLEKILRGKLNREDIYVFNAAIGAFISTQERLAYELAVAPRKPDLVIDLNGYNDIFAPLELGVAPGDPIQTGKRYGQIYSNAWCELLASNSSLFRYFKKAYINNYLSRRKEEILRDKLWSNNLVGGITDVYVQNMKLLIHRGHQSGTPTLVMFQPWKSLSNRQQTGSWGNVEFNQDPEAHFQFLAYKRIKDGLSLEEKNGDFIDISNIFSYKPALDFYTDSVHVDDRGQAIIADKIADILTPLINEIVSKRPASRVLE